MSPCPDDPPVQADPRELTRCCALGLVRETERIPLPRLVRSRDPLRWYFGGRKKCGHALSISDVYKKKPMYPSGDHGRGSLLAPKGVHQPPGKTGPRSDQHSHSHAYTVD